MRFLSRVPSSDDRCLKYFLRRLLASEAQNKFLRNYRNILLHIFLFVKDLSDKWACQCVTVGLQNLSPHSTQRGLVRIGTVGLMHSIQYAMQLHEYTHAFDK